MNDNLKPGVSEDEIDAQFGDEEVKAVLGVEDDEYEDEVMDEDGELHSRL